MYDSFSSDYDRFVNWPSRLSSELPFIQQQLQWVRRTGSPTPHVLDAACGTGVHAIALAKSGFTLTGADLSSGMIEKARLNSKAEGVDVRFEVVGFGGWLKYLALVGLMPCSALEILCLISFPLRRLQPLC